MSPLVERPATWRAGIFQLRPALFGWQYRIRIYGLGWEPWQFKYGLQNSVRRKVQQELGEGFVEVPLEEAAS